MHTCPHLVHLGVAVDSNALLYVFLFSLPTDLKQCSPCELAECLPRHKGAVEDKGPGREGCGRDADTQQRDSMGQRQHEGQVSSQNASICTA